MDGIKIRECLPEIIPEEFNQEDVDSEKMDEELKNGINQGQFGKMMNILFTLEDIDSEWKRYNEVNYMYLIDLF